MVKQLLTLGLSLAALAGMPLLSNADNQVADREASEALAEGAVEFAPGAKVADSETLEFRISSYVEVREGEEALPETEEEEDGIMFFSSTSSWLESQVTLNAVFDRDIGKPVRFLVPAKTSIKVDSAKDDLILLKTQRTKFSRGHPEGESDKEKKARDAKEEAACRDTWLKIDEGYRFGPTFFKDEESSTRDLILKFGLNIPPRSAKTLKIKGEVSVRFATNPIKKTTKNLTNASEGEVLFEGPDSTYRIVVTEKTKNSIMFKVESGEDWIVDYQLVDGNGEILLSGMSSSSTDEDGTTSGWSFDDDEIPADYRIRFEVATSMQDRTYKMKVKDFKLP